MPLFIDCEVFGSGRFRIWETTEEEDFFGSRVSMRTDDSDRLARIGNNQGRKHWLACRYMLSQADKKPVFVDYDNFGRPLASHREYEIAISHSGSMAAIMVHPNKRIGLDVEYFRPQIERVASRVFSLQELEYVAEHDRIVYLTLMWAAKEAMFKLIGEGGVNYCNDLVVNKIEVSNEGTFSGFYLRFGIKYPVEFYYKVFNNFVVVSCINE